MVQRQDCGPELHSGAPRPVRSASLQALGRAEPDRALPIFGQAGNLLAREALDRLEPVRGSPARKGVSREPEGPFPVHGEGLAGEIGPARTAPAPVGVLQHPPPSKNPEPPGRIFVQAGPPRYPVRRQLVKTHPSGGRIQLQKSPRSPRENVTVFLNPFWQTAPQLSRRRNNARAVVNRAG